MSLEMWMGFPILMLGAGAFIIAMFVAALKNERRNRQQNKGGDT